MEIGVQIPHVGAHASPSFVRSYCRAAEAAGFHGLWAVDHLVVPSYTTSSYTLSSSPRAVTGQDISETMGLNLEQNAVLALAAEVTTSVSVGCAVSVLPLRDPILMARQLATIDLCSGGRLVYGVGLGWLREEFAAVGAPWRERGARAEEQIAILRHLWGGRSGVPFEGQHWQLPAMDPRPRPHRGTIPILIGGHTGRALERVARIGDGWITARMSVERFAEGRREIGRLCEVLRHDLAPKRMVTWASDPTLRSEDPDLAEAHRDRIAGVLETYRTAGADHLRVGGDVRSPTASLEWLDALSDVI